MEKVSTFKKSVFLGVALADSTNDKSLRRSRIPCRKNSTLVKKKLHICTQSVVRYNYLLSLASCS